MRLTARSLARLLLTAGLILVWTRTAHEIALVWPSWGLFRLIGSDFALYFAQASALRAGDLASLYDLSGLNTYLQPLASFSGTNDPLRVGPVPYPPLFAWLVAPLTWLSPPAAFGVWTAINLLAGVILAWRCASLFRRCDRWWIMLVVLSSVATVQNLLGGQPMLLQACGVAECFLALRSGRDFRAGLWLSCLFFKPPYALFVGPLLLVKRRWSAVGGAALGMAIGCLGSVLASSVTTLLEYPHAIIDLASFRTGTNAFAEQMINWRALILFVAPQMSDFRALLVALGLSVATVAVLAPVWRTPWAPTERFFSHRMCALLIATVLANYHSHIYGGVLLALPLAALFADGRPNRVTTLTVGSLIFGSTLLPAANGLLPGVAIGVAPLLQIMLLAALVALVAEILRGPANVNVSTATQQVLHVPRAAESLQSGWV